jgi:peptidoglycan/xylan/chitin deacetylase (PgdA/CDA1 family)
MFAMCRLASAAVLSTLLSAGCGKPVVPGSTLSHQLRSEIGSLRASVPAKTPFPLNAGREVSNRHPGYSLAKNRGTFSFPAAHTPKMIAITMDVETTGNLAPVLDELKKNGFHMTFFICGSYARTHAEMLRRIASEGHEFGNHTVTHPWLSKSSDAKIRDEFLGVEKMVHDATGSTTRPYFRPPYGARNAKVDKVAEQLGFRDIMWNCTAADAQFPRPSVEKVLSLIMAAKPGSIFLCHSFVDSTTKALVLALPKLKAKGIKVCTISDMVEAHLAAAKSEPPKPQKPPVKKR